VGAARSAAAFCSLVVGKLSPGGYETQMLTSPSMTSIREKPPVRSFWNFTRRGFLYAIAACSTAASRASDDEAIWSQYLTWLKGRVVGDLVGLDSYRKVLTEQGLPKAEVDRRMAVIDERSLRRPEAMRLWFNSMYGPRGAVGPDWPTPFLMEIVKGVKPGTALDVCMGEGRNSIFLAGLGWKVTGFDVSDVAIANALARAKKAGVEITAVRSGYQEFDFGRERWDLIVMTFAYFPIRDKEYVNRLIESMRRGGLLAFQYGVLKPGADEKGDAALLGIPEERELKTIFRDLRILRYQEAEELSDWQVGEEHHKGQSVKMLAQKL
jgi:SAM-dependent methyltransferase